MRLQPTKTFGWAFRIVCATTTAFGLSGCESLQRHTQARDEDAQKAEQKAARETMTRPGSGPTVGSAGPTVTLGNQSSNSNPADRNPKDGFLSPEGKIYFFNWAISGTNQIWRVSTEGPGASGAAPFPQQLTNSNAPTHLEDMTADGKYLIAKRGEPAGQSLLLIPVNGEPTITVATGPESTDYAWSGVDGETLFYGQTKQDEFVFSAFSLTTRKAAPLLKSQGHWRVADVWGDRTFLFEVSRTENGPAVEYLIWTVGDSQPIPIVAPADNSTYQVRFANGPDEFFVLTNQGDRYRRLFIVRGGHMTEATIQESNDIERFEIDHRRFQLYLERNVGGRVQVEALNPKSLDAESFPSFRTQTNEAPREVRVTHVSRFGRYVSVSVRAEKSATHHYVYDWASKKLSEWTQPSMTNGR